MRWTGLDETLANKIIDGLHRLIDEMASDPGHSLRAKAEEGLERLAHDLQHKPELRAKVEAFKDEMLENQAFQKWVDGLWEASRAGLLRVARDPERVVAGRMGEALAQFGHTLQHDRRLADTINRFARRTAWAQRPITATPSSGWSRTRSAAGTRAPSPGRLENAVGRDLQYIRINGTLVGALVGLTIHTIVVLS